MGIIMGIISSEGKVFKFNFEYLFMFTSIYLLSYFILILTNESQQYFQLVLGSLSISMIISGFKLYYNIFKYLILATHNNQNELSIRVYQKNNINQQLSV